MSFCFRIKKSDVLQRIAGIPEMTNRGADMKVVIDFLASGSPVVTNSYHGAYWEMCLGRRVLCLPFGQKFRFFRDNPVFADPADWFQCLGRAEARPAVLGDARARNLAFSKKVRALAD